MPVALVTGASAGLGRALALELARRGWTLVVDARDAGRLGRTTEELRQHTTVHSIEGDVSQPAHRLDLAAAADAVGGLDLLVNNASTLGPTPLRPLAGLTPGEFRQILEVNTVAPLALTELLLAGLIAHRGTVLNLTSDAAAEHYPTWGGYGASKAALDHLNATMGVENPTLRFYSVDPGDLRTDMHQAAFPGEDIGDRPLPETVVGPILSLLHVRPPSGRYRAADLAADLITVSTGTAR